MGASINDMNAILSRRLMAAISTNLPSGDARIETYFVDRTRSFILYEVHGYVFNRRIGSDCYFIADVSKEITANGRRNRLFCYACRCVPLTGSLSHLHSPAKARGIPSTNSGSMNLHS